MPHWRRISYIIAINAHFNMQLKQIATLNAGYPFRGKIPEVAGSNIVAVQMKDVSPTEGIHWNSCVTTQLSGKRNPGWLQPGDILVAARGNHNYTVEVDESLLQTGFQAVAAPHFFVVNLKYQDVLPDYLTWFLNQAPCQRYFEQNAEGSLAKSIRRSVLENVPIVVPPLSKQRAIIQLARTLTREQQLLEQLQRNGDRLMNAIANDLLNDKEVAA